MTVIYYHCLSNPNVKLIASGGVKGRNSDVPWCHQRRFRQQACVTTDWNHAFVSPHFSIQIHTGHVCCCAEEISPGPSKTDWNVTSNVKGSTLFYITKSFLFNQSYLKLNETGLPPILLFLLEGLFYLYHASVWEVLIVCRLIIKVSCVKE